MIKKEAEHTSELKGLAEMNLMEYPFALLHPNDKRKAIVCEVWIKENDRRVQVRWTAAVDVFSQLPTELGVRVFHALLLLAERHAWAQRVQFTIYQILKILGLPTTKHYYEAVKQELVSLTDVTITSEGTFWDNAKKKRVSLYKFHLLDELAMTYTIDGKQITEHEGKNYVVIGAHVLRSIEANYIKQISYGVWLGLKKPVSRLLYIFLLKWMGYRDRCEIDVFQLASRLGLTSYKYPSKVREKLQPAFDELTSIGFLARVEYVTVGAYSRVRFIKSSKYEIQESHLQPSVDVFAEGAPADKWEQIREQYGVSEEQQGLWEKVLGNLKSRMPAQTFYSFVEPTLLLSIENDVATVLVESHYAQDWLQRQMGRQFTDELNYHLRAAGKQLVTSVSIETLAEQQEAIPSKA
jgi:hypothetical protein